MNIFINKLAEIEKYTSSQKGEYDLFALFLREEADKWDILVSAIWIENNKADALRYLAEIIQRRMTKDELALISRIVIIDESDPALANFQHTISVEHGVIEVKNSNLFGLPIKHAFLVTSKNRQAA